jgi:hypothetical protein
MCLKHTDGLAGLHQQRLVVLERGQFPDDRIVRGPVPCRFSGSPVDDEIVRALGDLGIEIVHEHPERRFLRPAFAGQRCASRRSNGTGDSGHERCETES